jgi:hypothetical protein
MKSYSMLVVALAVFGSAALSAPVALAQQSPSQPPAATQNEIPFILVELSGSLNAKKLKPGDKIKAQVAQDVLSHGRIIIPAESKLLGHVTEASGRGDNVESRLGLVFDKVLLKHHEEMNFQGVVQAVAPPVPRKSHVDETDQMLPPPIVSSQSTMTPMNSGRPNQNTGSNSAPRPMTTSSNVTVRDAQVTTGPFPGTAGYNPAKATSDPSAQNRSLSLGMRQGVFGLKGLNLSTETNGLTPGPVIVSKVADVKLDSGTQVLLRVITPPAHP